MVADSGGASRLFRYFYVSVELQDASPLTAFPDDCTELNHLASCSDL